MKYTHVKCIKNIEGWDHAFCIKDKIYRIIEAHEKYSWIRIECENGDDSQVVDVEGKINHITTSHLDLCPGDGEVELIKLES